MPQPLVIRLPYESLDQGYGVIWHLKMAEEHDKRTRQPGEQFNRRVILSQSSHNPFSCIDPNAVDVYDDMSGSACLAVWFSKPIRIRAIRITAVDSVFPRSLEICYGPSDKIARSVTAADLNGEGKQLVIELANIMSDQYKIRQTGRNWQGG
jgi:hypothetical protein